MHALRNSLTARPLHHDAVFTVPCQEKISRFSNTGNDVVDSNGIWTSHLQEQRSAALPVELSSHWERCAHLIRFKCTRNSRDDLTLSVTIYNVSILFQNHPQRNMKRKFHHFLKLVTSTEKQLTRAGFEFEHTVPSHSIVQLVERRIWCSWRCEFKSRKSV